jgi:hypothetical protein
MIYGDKRNYRKIDIFINGKYECSTTWANTCKEARVRYIEEHKHAIFMAKVSSVKAHFAKVN